MQVRNSKSLLAKLLATENLKVVYAPVATASFAPVERVLTIPIYKTELTEDEIDLFIGHEVGHALYTPAEDPKKWVKGRRGFMSFINIVEDVRIEKLIQHKFPGLRRNFRQGYNDLINRGFFGDYSNSDLSFIDRVNIFFKTGDASIPFSEDEQNFVNKIQNVETWEETVNVTEELYKYCANLQEEKEKEEKEENVGGDDVGGDDDENGNGGEGGNEGGDDDEDGSGSGSGSVGESESGSVGDEDGSGDDDEDGSGSVGGDDDEDGSGSSGRNGKGSGESGNEVDELDSETEKMMESFLESMVEDGQTSVHDVKLPSLESAKSLVADFDYIKQICERSIYPYTSRENYEKHWKKFVASQKSFVNYMVKEFEMKKRAAEYKRTKVSKTGRLNMSSLHKYRFSEDIFSRNEIVKDGKSHGFFMVVDWSGSMNDCIKNVISQIQLLVLFCQKVNVPFEVYAFTTELSGNDYDSVVVPSELWVKDCGLLHLASSTMSRSQLHDSMVTLTTIKQKVKNGCPSELRLGGTPLNSAIMLTTTLSKEFKRKNNIDILNTIFLTDGEGSPSIRYLDINSQGNKSIEYICLNDYVTINDKYNLKRLLDGTGKSENALFNIMRKETGCNLIGYYMVPDYRWLQRIINLYSRETLEPINQEEIKGDAFYKIPVKCHFYDDMFVVMANNLFMDNDKGYSDEILSVEEIAESFGEQRKTKVNTRSFLKKFMELLS